MNNIDRFIRKVNFNNAGLVSTIAQDIDTSEVLMLAWQNYESLELSLKTGEMVYFSRSRNRLWKKGEDSGHIQKIHGIYLDCDGDSILAKVTQYGGISCHTGRKSCFYRQYSNVDGVIENMDVIKNPKLIYKK